MREIFEAELKQLGADLVTMSQQVELAISGAGTALLTGDVPLAESVIVADAGIDSLERDIDERSVLILAQQAPVAIDLRIVVSALRMSATLERMGDLARHVAEVARGRARRPDVGRARSPRRADRRPHATIFGGCGARARPLEAPSRARGRSS